MEYAVATVNGPIDAVLPVPPSKSLHQRVLVLDHLATQRTAIDVPEGTPASGDDVRLLGRALERLGRWTDGALGPTRESMHLDLGMGGTGFRFCMPLAALRREGARTLIGGAPTLLARPHDTLRRALVKLGARIKRRHSGAMRVLGGGVRGGTIRLDARRSSQFASALLLAAPRIGGLTLDLDGPPASLPYLELTVELLRAFGVPVHAERLGVGANRIRIETAEPQCDRIELEPDASCAAAWWTAAALSGGTVIVPGLDGSSRQADVALLALLERTGARVEDTPRGTRVHGSNVPGALGDVDLLASPDLIFLAGVLAARAESETVLRGLRNTRRKESDRVAVLAAGLQAMGADVSIEEDGDVVRIRGGALQGTRVAVSGDHRAAFAFGVLGLVVPGIVLRGAEAATKSHPSFLDDLGSLARRAPRGESLADG